MKWPLLLSLYLSRRYMDQISSAVSTLYTSMKVMVAPATGYTSGQALAAIAEVAKENLPDRFRLRIGRYGT